MSSDPSLSPVPIEGQQQQHELASPSNVSNGNDAIVRTSNADLNNGSQVPVMMMPADNQQLNTQPEPVLLASPSSGGWIAPSADSGLNAAADAGGAIPQAVSEQSQEDAKKETAAKELKEAGFFKQTLAKVRGNLCGPLHAGDALFVAWIIFWFIITGTTKGGIKWLWLVIALCSYVWYLKWNWKSDERMFIWTMMDVGSFETYWKELRAQIPIITMRTESWHWERRTHTHTTYNANGGSSTTTTVTYVRTVTHTESMTFNFRLCVDLSLDVLGSDLEKNNATFVHMWKEYSFGDANTALTYYNQLTALKQRNQGKDKFLDSAEWMTIPNWMSLVGVYRDAASRPMGLRKPFFAIACIFLLTWPFKIYCEWAAKKGGFTCKKQVTL